MLSVFLLHIVITLVCSLTGLLFYSFLLKKEQGTIPLIFYPVTGLIVITLISQLAVLFIPINNFFTLGFLVILFCIAIAKRRNVGIFYKSVFVYVKKQPRIQLLLACVLWLMILVLNAGPTMMDDTESYHIQMIEWANEYGTVPGIANLHSRFGFNSSWFISISFFLPGESVLNFYTTLNGVISVWLCLFLVFGLTPFFKQKESSVKAMPIAMVLVLMLSLFCWPMIRGNSTTANYDFITTALVLILFIKSLQRGMEIKGGVFITELIIWPVYLFTVRIVNYPLLLLSIYGFYLLLKNREWLKTAIYLIICSLLAIAFLARNVILSGYPFYPATAFNVFDVDWKANREMIKELIDYIKYYNRVNEGLMSIEETSKLHFPSWVFAWFQNMFSYDKLVVITGLSGLLINFAFVKRLSRIFGPIALLFLLVFLHISYPGFLLPPVQRFVWYLSLWRSIVAYPAVKKPSRQID